jgi:hypothetical protein
MVTPDTSHEATSSPIADEPRKTTMRNRKRITHGA